MITTTVPTVEELNQVAIDRIIDQAERLSKDKSLNVWKDVYEPAKWAIAEFGLGQEEYQNAISRLTEALNI